MTEINNLLVEILSAIFLIATDDIRISNGMLGNKYLSTSHPTTRTMGPPYTLLHVCRHWRAVAKTTRLLWSSLDLSLGYRKMLPPVDAFAHWLSLSDPSPLNIFLGIDLFSLSVGEVSTKHTGNMLNLIAKEGYRLQSLAVRMNPNFTDLLSNMLVSTPLPNLRRIQISAQPYNLAQISIDRLGRGVACIKSLTDLSLHLGTRRNIEIPTTSIPWSQLTTLHIASCISVDEAIFILKHSLVAVSVVLSLRFSVTRFDPPSLVLHTLETLSIMLCDNQHNLLDHVELPALQKLDIRIGSLMPLAPGHYKSVEGLLRRSNPLITIVYITMAGCGRFSTSVLAEYLCVERLHAVPRVMFSCTDIYSIAATALEEHRIHIPGLCGWIRMHSNSFKSIGWNTLSNEDDEYQLDSTWNA